MTELQITINSRKFDGSLRRSWEAGIVSQKEDLIIAIGRFAEDVKHDDLGLIRKGTVSFEHFWTNRWYNVFRFHEPDGTLRNYYCNLAMPAILNGRNLDYIDLDIDVVVWPNGEFEVLDMDDFERNSRIYSYPGDLIARTEKSLAELLTVIRRNELP